MQLGEHALGEEMVRSMLAAEGATARTTHSPSVALQPGLRSAGSNVQPLPMPTPNRPARSAAATPNGA